MCTNYFKLYLVCFIDVVYSLYSAPVAALDSLMSSTTHFSRGRRNTLTIVLSSWTYVSSDATISSRTCVRTPRVSMRVRRQQYFEWIYRHRKKQLSDRYLQVSLSLLLYDRHYDSIVYSIFAAAGHKQLGIIVKPFQSVFPMDGCMYVHMLPVSSRLCAPNGHRARRNPGQRQRR